MRKPSAVEWPQKLTGVGPIHSPVPCYTSSPKRKTKQNKTKHQKQTKNKNTKTHKPKTLTNQTKQTKKTHSDVTGAS